jgi:hypothetical protein
VCVHYARSTIFEDDSVAGGRLSDSGCRDEYGIRRHSLKSETVRVLTLLRSAYESEDTVDTALIKAATELDIQAPKNSILWRPGNVAGQLTEGKLVLDLYAIS